MDDVRIGRSLRALLVRRGLTQRELGALIGLAQSTVSLVERGHLDRLSVRTLGRIFAMLDARFDGQVTWRAGARRVRIRRKSCACDDLGCARGHLTCPRGHLTCARDHPALLDGKNTPGRGPIGGATRIG